MSKKLILITSKFHDMTNNQPWQAIVNANNFIRTEPSVNPLSIAKKDHAGAKQPKTYTKVILAKRFSIDDNGGGYQGL